ncbi:MAG: hypothetical protein JWP20_2766, partial [Roseomonas sp.]|nr:hypothetical protein [Roseomonas sp.]
PPVAPLTATTATATTTAVTNATATAAQLAAVPGGARYGAIYLAPAPATGLGLSAGQADREAAHRIAGQRCIGGQSTLCRLALEFHDRCGAVAHGLTPRGLFLTDSPSTFSVMAAAAGAGATQDLAERDAMAHCRQIFRGTCRVARSLCDG